MQCTQNSGKASSHTAALLSILFPLCVVFLVHSVSIPTAVRPTLLQQMDIGCLTCAHIWVLAIHTHEGGAAAQLREPR